MSWKKKGTEKEIEISAPQPAKQMQTTASVKNEVEEKETVVSELPQLPARQIKGDDGNIYRLVTQNEAIQEILESVRELLKRTEE